VGELGVIDGINADLGQDQLFSWWFAFKAAWACVCGTGEVFCASLESPEQ
jgi:hypothetical protein